MFRLILCICPLHWTSRLWRAGTTFYSVQELRGLGWCQLSVDAQYTLKNACTAASPPVLFLGYHCFLQWKELLGTSPSGAGNWHLSSGLLLRPVPCGCLFPAPNMLFRFSCPLVWSPAKWGPAPSLSCEACPDVDSPPASPLIDLPHRNHNYF